ncbi:hypothetical protein CEXT_193111 [Caerostris extrusa]|uniref:Uncharacterized protein n=1 Tax=Caerostris extrusa TaxID=172846 RepID=A0AAV4RXY8_CAEEX|nr:hypothetical protein CEXT_193021 [Caerostris extrusa]GIY25163.1 hypothetical protein CEXT_193111 [Caerostris extrusa]
MPHPGKMAHATSKYNSFFPQNCCHRQLTLQRLNLQPGGALQPSFLVGRTNSGGKFFLRASQDRPDFNTFFWLLHSHITAVFSSHQHPS